MYLVYDIVRMTLTATENPEIISISISVRVVMGAQDRGATCCLDPDQLIGRQWNADIV